MDDRSKQYRTTRLISFAAPVVVLAIWCVITAANGFNGSTIAQGIVTLFIAQASYFHLKHLIIKDVDYGLIRSIRSYNLLALVYALLCMLEMLTKSFNLPAACVVIIYVLQCAVMLAFVPELERGVKKWTT